MGEIKVEAFPINKLVALMLEQHPWWTAMIVLLLGLFGIGLSYIILKERLSKKSKDIAETGKLMAETLKSNTESLATAPQIVVAFSTLIENALQKEMVNLDLKIAALLDTEFGKRASEINKNTEHTRNVVRELSQLKDEMEDLETSIKNKAKDISKQLALMKSVLPDYEVWKNVADPELLYRNLTSTDSWSKGKDIVGQIQKLVEDSEERPEQIPAKYIEYTGDWCRKQHQYPLALWFYSRAVKRDPELIGAEVELYSLQAEYVPPERQEALQKLSKIALSDQITLGYIRRVFNVFIEIDKYHELVGLCSELLQKERYRHNNACLSTFLRNRAVAKSSIVLGQRTDDIWEDIREAYRLEPADENNLNVIVGWLLKSKQAQDAIEESKKLIRLGPTDVSYYIFLAQAYALNKQNDLATKVLARAEPLAVSPIDEFKLSDGKSRVEKIIKGNDDSFLEEIE